MNDGRKRTTLAHCCDVCLAYVPIEDLAPVPAPASFARDEVQACYFCRNSFTNPPDGALGRWGADVALRHRDLALFSNLTMSYLRELGERQE